MAPITPPCSLAPALFEARLLSDGAFSALPIEETAPVKSIPINPTAGPMKGVANRLAENKRLPIMTRTGSPKRFTSLPIKPP